MLPGIDRLNALPRFSGEADDSFKPGLDRMHALLAEMGDPHQAYRSIHIAGTNGKGSTASMAAAILTAGGVRTGLHTSPELVHVAERMRVDGSPAPLDWLSQAVLRYADAFDRIAPSFFEATVALSFLYFAETDVDAAVVEVGLGGRLDATNVLSPDACIITSIDLEHTQLLGDTLGEIAREKAGIIKRGTPCVTGVAQPEALAAIRAVATEHEAPLHGAGDELTIAPTESDRLTEGRAISTPAPLGERIRLRTPDRDYGPLHLSLTGGHQQTNAALAVRALECGGFDPSVSAVRRGLADVRRFSGLRGRLDVLSDAPLIVADVAHNPSSLTATLSALSRHHDGPVYVGLGLAKDKDAQDVARLLAGRDVAVIPLHLEHPRMRSAPSLATVLEEAGASVHPPQNVSALRKQAPGLLPDGAALLLTGSHHVVREAIESDSE